MSADGSHLPPGKINHVNIASSESDEVEFLRKTYLGTEVIVIHDDEPNTANGASTPITPFRFLDLPAELRCHIYSFVIPSLLVITFEHDGFNWVVHGLRKGESGTQEIGGEYGNVEPGHITVETQLFLVNKFISNECQGRVPHLTACLPSLSL
jgi:hypothetical protein